MLLKLAWGNVRKSVRDFAIYFVTVLLGVAIFYAFNSVTDQQAFASIGDGSSMRKLLSMVVSYVSVFIALVLAFLVIYANRFLIRRRSKEFGTYLTLGMRTGQVLAIVGLETLLVGVLSLLCGLALGIGLSQLLMYGTAFLFQEPLEGFAFGFSKASALTTLALFAGIFFVAALMNARRIIATPLIQLLHANRANEKLVLRNLPLSVGLFILAVICIGYSYELLLENGLLEPSPQFLAATILVCLGTFLFFYSLSGFLLKLLQWIRPLYLRGLTMFTSRQLNAKLNSTVASMTIVCIALFLSITSVCGGIGIVNAMDRSVAESTAYDISVNTNWMSASRLDEGGSLDSTNALEDLGPYGDFARSCDFAMERGLVESIRTVDGIDIAPLISQSAQVDFWVDPTDPLRFSDFEEVVPKGLMDFMGTYINDSYQDIPVSLVRLSDANAALALAGKDTLSLGEDEAQVVYTSAYMADFWRQFAESHPTLSVSEYPLRISDAQMLALETTPIPLDTGSLIVPDAIVGDQDLRIMSYLDLMLHNPADETEVTQALEAVQASTIEDTWPVHLVMSREDVLAQTSGLTGVIAFLAIYIGFILTVACAAILAIQQLSEASDNARRYNLLRKLGAPESMIALSLFVQIAIYFLAPLLLALSHSACAMGVVATVISIFGNLDIGQTALLTAGAFLATYGVYFLITYFTARKLTT